MTEPLEQRAGEQGVDLVVLCDQNREAMQSAVATGTSAALM